MSSAGNEALVNSLQRAREHLRGDVLRATAVFECENLSCPATLVRVGINEKRGATKPFQPGNTCPRCKIPLIYVRLEVGR